MVFCVGTEDIIRGTEEFLHFSLPLLEGYRLGIEMAIRHNPANLLVLRILFQFALL